MFDFFTSSWYSVSVTSSVSVSKRSSRGIGGWFQESIDGSWASLSVFLIVSLLHKVPDITHIVDPSVVVDIKYTKSRD